MKVGLWEAIWYVDQGEYPCIPNYWYCVVKIPDSVEPHDEQIWRFDYNKPSKPEAWVFGIPENAIEDDTAYLPDEYDWWIKHLYKGMDYGY